MVESRYYQVAGHLFCLEGDRDSLDHLSNYAPFCYHPDIESPLPLFHLHINQASPFKNLTIEHVFTDQSEADMPRIEVDRLGTEAWLLQIAPSRDADICCLLTATANFSEAWLSTADPRLWTFSVNNAAMLLFAFASVHTGTLEMHASVVKRQGKGYLFLGKSGTGKSTHSRQWLAAFSDATLLNDDNPVLRVYEQDGKVSAWVYGSPWSGKTPCYINDGVPVGGIVKLNQAPHNEVHIMRLPEAYAYILSSSSGMKIIPETMDKIYATIARLVENQAVHAMDCLPDADAARVCWHAVSQS